jgi:predicted Zn-dependent protease
MGEEGQPGKEKPIQDQAQGENAAPDSSVFIQIAESMRLQGRHDEAIEICKGGLIRMPDSLLGRLLLGRCYLEKGMIGAAKEELERVARGIEECLSVYKLLSQVYLQEKDVEKALEVLRKSIYFESAEEGAAKRVTPLEMGFFQPGARPPFATPPPLQKASKQEPARVEGEPVEEEKGSQRAIQTDTLAEIYIKQGHLDRALAIYQDILGRNPNNPAIREKYESLKEKMGEDRKRETQKRVQSRLEKWLAVVSAKRVVS